VGEVNSQIRSVVGGRALAAAGLARWQGVPGRVLLLVASVEGVYGTWRLCQLKACGRKKRQVKKADSAGDEEEKKAETAGASVGPLFAFARGLGLQEVREGGLRQRRRGVKRTRGGRGGVAVSGKGRAVGRDRRLGERECGELIGAQERGAQRNGRGRGKGHGVLHGRARKLGGR
jgi:hypothetical protein